MVPVKGDGNCLFHALGFLDSVSGDELRDRVIDYMLMEVVNQPPAEASIWMEEADTLRSNAWGGHTAVAAYSMMTRRRVIIHRKDEGGYVQAVVVSHASIPGDAMVQHILYINGNHYDALLEVSCIDGMTPAWEQPLPPHYFSMRRLCVDGASHQSRTGEVCIATSSQRKSSVKVWPSRACKLDSKLSRGSVPREALKEAVGPASATRGHHWYREKSAPASGLRDDLATELARVRVRADCGHPHRAQEDLIKEFYDVFVLLSG